MKALLKKKILQRIRPDYDPQGAAGKLSDDEHDVIYALAQEICDEVELPFVQYQGHVDDLTSTKPGALDAFKDAVRLLNEAAGKKSASAFDLLGSTDRQAVLHSVLRSYANPVTNSPLRHKLRLTSENVDALLSSQRAIRFRRLVMRPLLSIYYHGPTGWAVVGRDTYPGKIGREGVRHLGVLRTVSMDEFEETGELGLSEVSQLTREGQHVVQGCVQCGCCEDVCPAHATGKPLSPKALMGDVRDLIMLGDEGPALHGEKVSAETVWSCTMCQACVDACPVLIDQADIISEMRRHLVSEGELAGPPAEALRSVESRKNPFSVPNEQRMEWTKGLDVSVPTTDENPDFEVLLWLGCAVSFDPRAQRVARSTVELFHRAGVNFAVLGKNECCTGDPARRMGDEFLFQELAETNTDTLNSVGAKKIVTPCPHCLNSLSNEYPTFGGDYEVQHHSQFLAQLHEEGKLTIEGPVSEKVTFHDPCYLARINDETEAPRKLLKVLKRDEPKAHRKIREMPRNGRNTFCCGAGGGRMYFDEAPEERVSVLRANEAMETGADVLVTGCPFCLNMMTDGMASAESEVEMRVMDLAELLNQPNGKAT